MNNSSFKPKHPQYTDLTKFLANGGEITYLPIGWSIKDEDRLDRKRVTFYVDGTNTNLSEDNIIIVPRHYVRFFVGSPEARGFYLSNSRGVDAPITKGLLEYIIQTKTYRGYFGPQTLKKVLRSKCLEYYGSAHTKVFKMFNGVTK